MAYSVVADLLLGDLVISSDVDPAKFVTDAAEEIDSKIGWIYETPLVLNNLLRHESLLIKGINNRLASGRLILTLDIAGEGTSLHAYGLRLVTEANGDLLLIANGQLDLSAPKIDNPGKNKNNTPTISSRDAASAVEAFEDRFMRPGYTPAAFLIPGWQPGG